MSSPNSSGAKAPDYAKLYKEGIQTDLKFLPQQLAAEYGYRQQYSPQFTQQALDLQHQYDPQLAQEQLDALGRRDPQWLAMHQSLGDKIQTALNRGYIDPTQHAAYQALGNQVTGDTLRGQTMSPDMLKQTTQAILSRSPNLSYGEAQDMAASTYVGQRGQQLQQQRQAATNQFLGQQTPEMQAYGLAGTYIQPSNSVTGAINQIQGVTAPTASQYVNPNASSQALQFGLNNYQNTLASQNSGSGNPWQTALSGAATGAQYGSIGGGYGAVGGALTGAVAGAFGYPQYSSERLKKDVVKVGEKNGLDVVEFRYRTPRSALFRGVIAEQVKELYPNAVVMLNGFLAVKYEEIGIPFEKYCTKCQQFKNINEFYVEKRKVKRLCTHSAHCIPCAKKASFEWSLRNRESKRRVNQRRRKAERKYEREKWRSDIVFKLKCRLRWFLRHHVKAGKKSARARELLGCSVEDFKTHLQNQFRDGMAWNNYGKWHIDHIRPCSSFDLLDPKQQQLCFHYTNTQPLWAEENRLKGDTWVIESEVN